MSSVHHVIYLPSWSMPFIYVIQSSIHYAIQSPYHLFTLPSTHIYHVVHSPHHPVRIMVHAIHLPCHPPPSQPVTMSFRPSSYQPQVTRPLRSLTRKSSWSCWRPPWRGAPASVADPPLPFLPVLPSPPDRTLGSSPFHC